MLDILEKISNNPKFLEINFEEYPFQLKKKEGENLSILFNYIVENLETNDPNIKNQINTYIISFDNDVIKLKDKCDFQEIYRYPITFELLFEDKPAFKVYSSNQLADAINELKNYFCFFINNSFKNNNDVKEYVKMKKENRINNNKIRLVPFIYEVFRNYDLNNKYEDLINNEEEFTQFDIDKEILEPYFLFIEKKEIAKKIGIEKMKNFKKNLLENKLAFIINKERRNFISKLDNYIQVDIQKEPMIIIGNDGVGKSLTLQFYTLLEKEGFKKLYFNLKLLKFCKNRDYILIELIRGFTSKNQTEKYFKEYLECIKILQDDNFSGVKHFFIILKKIMNKLKRNSDKYVVIIDQFNFEKISLDDFNEFKYGIQDHEKFKIILCCSLSDDKNKKEMFSDYTDFLADKLLHKINITPLQKTPYNPKIETFMMDGTNIFNFYFVINMSQNNNKITNKEINNTMDDIYIKNDSVNEKRKEVKKKEEKDNQEKKLNITEIQELPSITKKEGDLYELLKDPNFHIPINFDNNKTSSNDELKIYYGKLISLETMFLKQKEFSEIKECMSYFNFLPKYYYKFYLFSLIKKLEGETNISTIINEFYKTQKNIIEHNINIFYSKLNLNNNKEFKINIYQNLLKFRRCIRKSYENSILFYKLFKYSLEFPFKYVNIYMKDGGTDIIFNDALKRKTFNLRYSFPLVEKIIESMIEEFNNNDKIDINELSGSGYGNALEVKMRENIDKFKEKIEIRKVWSLNLISDAVKKEKLREIRKNKDSSKRFVDLEDITEIKEITSSDNKFFYFKPENQDNKYFDSLFLIKNQDDDFSIIALQITKNKPKNKIKLKNTYANFLINNIKKKFEKLYKIKITKIYFWYILSFDTLNNNSLCNLLDNYEIKYAFYSIKNNCFYNEKNIEINNLNYFCDPKALIYPGVDNDNDDVIFEPNPNHIISFENTLFEEYKKNNKICFEYIRYRYFGNNFGPKIDFNLKTNIINTIKNYLTYSNKFEIMFLFAFPFEKIRKFRQQEPKDELLFLFKMDGKIYLSFQNKIFEINDNKELIECSFPKIDYINLQEKVKYHKDEIEFSLIEDISQNNITYLFKLYYLGNKLLKK